LPRFPDFSDFSAFSQRIFPPILYFAWTPQSDLRLVQLVAGVSSILIEILLSDTDAIH